MIRLSHISIFLFVFVVAGAALADGPASTDQQLRDLTAMCESSARARADRHAATSLHDRLGGYDRIHALTVEIVRLHAINPDIKHLVEFIDQDRLARHVADFMAAGTGGTAEYTGRTLPDAHRHLHLTDDDFMAAGADIVKAMHNLGHDQDVIDEVLCILLSLKDQVVFQ